MAKPHVLKISIPAGTYTKLEAAARGAELTPTEYIHTHLIMAMNSGALGYTASTGIGTGGNGGVGKIATKLDDIPVDVERGVTPGSYAGVTKRNGGWEARAGRTVLGRFSTPEVAALARYFAIVGYKAGRGAFYDDVNMIPDYAAKQLPKDIERFAPLSATQVAAGASARGEAELPTAVVPTGLLVEPDPAVIATYDGPPIAPRPSARRAKARGGAAPPSPAGDSRVGGDLQGVDPPAGPETAGGSRETSADGGRTPSTSIRDATEGGADGQADLCPICDGEMNPGIARKHPRYCLLCSDDYETWLNLPDDDDDRVDAEPPPPFEYTSANVKLAPEERAFMAYLMRARGLA